VLPLLVRGRIRHKGNQTLVVSLSNKLTVWPVRKKYKAPHQWQALGGPLIPLPGYDLSRALDEELSILN
jgi:hypothetical protein